MIGKIKKIVVATDFSGHSDAAILRAVDLAKLTKSQLIVLHVAKKRWLEKMIEDVIPFADKALLTPKEYAESLLKKQVAGLDQQKLNMTYCIISGDHPGVGILKYSKDNNVDLLVIGAHGPHSIHDWFVGTTAEYMAKKTQRPLLIIKKPPRKIYQKILVPIDFSDASKNALQVARQLFPKKDMQLLHVGDHEFQKLFETEIPKQKEKFMKMAVLSLLAEKAKKFIKTCGGFAKSTCVIKLGYPGTVIIEEAKKLNQDLIIMGTEGYSQRHYLSVGRVASRVLIEIDRDILLVPPES